MDTTLKNAIDQRSFVGFPIWTPSADAAAAQLLAPSDNRRLLVRLVNAYSLALASTDDSYARILKGEGVNLCDSRHLAGVLSAGRRVRVEQVRGPSLFVNCLDGGRRRGTRHVFVGGGREVLPLLAEQVSTRFPGVIVAGIVPWPFTPVDDVERENICERIREYEPDIVWLALGTPKQDFEAARIFQRLDSHVVAVGAAFDFVAGTVKEAPLAVRKLGLEWLYRLMAEPRRLWRRYAFGNLKFLTLAVKYLVSGGR